MTCCSRARMKAAPVLGCIAVRGFRRLALGFRGRLQLSQKTLSLEGSTDLRTSGSVVGSGESAEPSPYPILRFEIDLGSQAWLKIGKKLLRKHKFRTED